MPELDAAASQLLTAYVAELGLAIESLQGWWQALAAHSSRSQLRLRWPAGIASHPRVLAIYRDYHRRFSELALARPGGPTLRFDDDAAWGCPAELADLLPIAPERLLIDRLQIEAPELHTRMSPLVMSPVGLELEPRPSFVGLDMISMSTGSGLARAFGFEHRHGVERGVERLLGAAADLRTTSARVTRLADASEFHRLAHQAYTHALEQALIESERSWLRELEAREARGLTRDEAHADLFMTSPCGPVGHPRVLGVIQAYWVLCEQINVALGTHDRSVGPERLLLGWLDDGRHQTWVEILSAMPYWPIGLDSHGQWA